MIKEIFLLSAMAVILATPTSYAQPKRVVEKSPKRIVAPSKEFRVSLELAAVSATLKVEVRGPKKGAAKGAAFEGLKDCPTLSLSLAHLEETGKCLEFKTGGAKPVQIPIVVINATPPKAHEDIIDEGAQRVRADKKDWGELDIWKSPKNTSAHYFFLRSEDKDQMVRLGPVPDSVQKAFDLQMDLELW